MGREGYRVEGGEFNHMTGVGAPSLEAARGASPQPQQSMCSYHLLLLSPGVYSNPLPGDSRFNPVLES